MANKKRAFVSDIHFGGEFRPTELGKYNWNWLGENEANDFGAFLKFVRESGAYEELVILGDLFDDWVWPVDLDPPTFDDIVAAHQNRFAIQELKALCQTPGVRVVYLPGNHDMTATQAFVDKHFPGMVFGGRSHNDSVYRTSRLLAEHGSAHAMFNAPDPFNNPGSRLPLGYFISRVVATTKHRTGSGSRHYGTYVDDLFESLGPQTIAASVFEALLEEARLPQSVPIKIRLADGSISSVTGNEVKAKYANLFDQWCQARGMGRALLAVMAEFGHLGRIADSLCRKSDTNVVVFGHSHDWRIDKDSFLVDDRIYANCGTWCEDDRPRTFVETRKDERNRKRLVQVVEWKGGRATPLKNAKAEVPF